MESNAILETVGAALAIGAGLVRLLIVATTGESPDQLLTAAAVWVAAVALAGVPVGLLLSRGLRSTEAAAGPGAPPARRPGAGPRPAVPLTG